MLERLTKKLGNAAALHKIKEVTTLRGSHEYRTQEQPVRLI